MITYDYECNSCGFIFTFIQETYEENYNPKKCPECNSKKPIRLIPRIRTKSFYGPQHPRHRRGLSRNSLPINYPIYTKEDIK